MAATSSGSPNRPGGLSAVSASLRLPGGIGEELLLVIRSRPGPPSKVTTPDALYHVLTVGSRSRLQRM